MKPNVNVYQLGKKAYKKHKRKLARKGVYLSAWRDLEPVYKIMWIEEGLHRLRLKIEAKTQKDGLPEHANCLLRVAP